VTAANDDCTLYERWLENRDGDAFAEISRRHAPVVYDLAVRYSGDASLAEDLVQEALLDLALAGTRKPIEVGLIAWMARFAMCRARNLRSSERSRRKRQQIVGGRRPEDVMPDDHLERDEELQHALDRAEPGERVVLSMRYLHGWDYGRIASALVISEGAARVRVHRALGTLRSRLGVGPAAATATGTTTGTGASAGTNGRRNGSQNGTDGGQNGTDGGQNGTEGGTNGSARHSAPVVGLLAAQALNQMPDGLLALGTQSALEAAAAADAIGAGSGAQALPRVGRLTLQALGLSSAFVLATAVSLTVYEPLETRVAQADSLAAFFAPTSADRAGSTGTTENVERRWRGALPRPPEWDEGVLRRLSRDGRESAETASDAKAPEEPSVAAAPPLPDAPRDRSERPVEVPRPKLRDARAATRGPVSSVDERAGSSGGGSALYRARVPAFTTKNAPAPAASSVTAPGLPADLVRPDPTLVPRRRRLPVATTPLSDLPPEQADLVNEAAALVLQIVEADGLGAGGLAVSRNAMRRQARRLKKQYRATRKRLRRAALNANEVEITHEVAHAAKVRTAQYVLRLLMDVVLVDGRQAGDLVWPEGADVTAALEDVVSVLGTLVPDGAVSDPAAISVTAAPADLLPEGALPPGAGE